MAGRHVARRDRGGSVDRSRPLQRLPRRGQEILQTLAGEPGQSARRWGTRAGVVGLLARGIVFGLIGIFAVKAALEYDPKEAIGLDGALQKLAAQSYGSVLLGVVAAGFLCYAIFCVAEARYRKV